MGREIKRVPLSFAWPKDKIWQGFLNPHYDHYDGHCTNKTRANRWRRRQPPKGGGYQLWETVSEGSPISPVFKTPEELADWLVSSPDYEFAINDRGTTRDQWLRFINGPAWAPSMINSSRGLLTGVQAIT